MKSVLYTCPFVPAEWIAAHGLEARRITPAVDVHASGRFSEQGICPYAAGFARHVCGAGQDDATIFTTCCEQMRRMFDLAATQRPGPTFLLNVPTVVSTSASADLSPNSAAWHMYVGELRRMGRFLQQIGGTAPQRGSAADAPAHCVADAHHRRHAELNCNHAAVRLALTGGPLPKDSPFFSQVRAAGGVIVLDASEGGEMMLPATLNDRRGMDDPLGELARAYLNIPSIHRRPNTRFHDRLREQIAVRSASGLILRRYVWCDLWHAEARRLAETADVPVLDLEVESDSPAEQARNATRIGGFIEMLQAARAQATARCNAHQPHPAQRGAG